MAVSGCSEEYRLWHPLVVLHTPCLIKHTSNTLSDFLLQRVGKRTCARLLLNARAAGCLLRKALLMFCLSKMGQP